MAADIPSLGDDRPPRKGRLLDNAAVMETSPGAVRRFMDAAARRDYDAIGDCFTDDATVRDEGKTRRDREEIRQWQRETRATWDYTATVVSGRQDGEHRYRLGVHLHGNFPGGDADVEYRFTIRDELISRLQVE